MAYFPAHQRHNQLRPNSQNSPTIPGANMPKRTTVRPPGVDTRAVARPLSQQLIPAASRRAADGNVFPPVPLPSPQSLSGLDQARQSVLGRRDALASRQTVAAPPSPPPPQFPQYPMPPGLRGIEFATPIPSMPEPPSGFDDARREMLRQREELKRKQTGNAPQQPQVAPEMAPPPPLPAVPASTRPVLNQPISPMAGTGIPGGVMIDPAMVASEQQANAVMQQELERLERERGPVGHRVGDTSISYGGRGPVPSQAMSDADADLARRLGYGGVGDEDRNQTLIQDRLNADPRAGVARRQQEAKSDAMARLNPTAGVGDLPPMRAERFASQQPPGMVLSGQYQAGGQWHPIWRSAAVDEAMRTGSPLQQVPPGGQVMESDMVPARPNTVGGRAGVRVGDGSRKATNYNAGQAASRAATDEQLAANRQEYLTRRAAREDAFRERRTAIAQQRGDARRARIESRIPRPLTVEEQMMQQMGPAGMLRMRGQNMEAAQLEADRQARAALAAPEGDLRRAEADALRQGMSPEGQDRRRLAEIEAMLSSGTLTPQDIAMYQRERRELQGRLRPGTAPPAASQAERQAEAQAAASAAGLDPEMDIANASSSDLSRAIIDGFAPASPGQSPNEMTDEQLELIASQIATRQPRDLSTGAATHGGRQEQAIEFTVRGEYPPETRNKMIRAIAQWDGKSPAPVVDGYKLEKKKSSRPASGSFGGSVDPSPRYEWVPVNKAPVPPTTPADVVQGVRSVDDIYQGIRDIF